MSKPWLRCWGGCDMNWWKGYCNFHSLFACWWGYSPHLSSKSAAETMGWISAMHGFANQRPHGHLRLFCRRTTHPPHLPMMPWRAMESFGRKKEARWGNEILRNAPTIRRMHTAKANVRRLIRAANFWMFGSFAGGRTPKPTGSVPLYVNSAVFVWQWLRFKRKSTGRFCSPKYSLWIAWRCPEMWHSSNEWKCEFGKAIISTDKPTNPWMYYGNNWLVVWNHGILFFHILGNSSPQLTFTPSFFRGVGQPPTW